MAYVHFIAPSIDVLSDVQLNGSGHNIGVNPSMSTHDPMSDIMIFGRIWTTPLSQMIISDEMQRFVSMGHFLEFLRSLEGDTFLQQRQYSSHYNLVFSSSDDHSRFVEEVEARVPLTVAFSDSQVFGEAKDWLNTEYAHDRDYCAISSRITCRDAELASMLRLKYSPNCN